MNIVNKLLNIFRFHFGVDEENIEYQFSILTQYGRQYISDFHTLRQELDNLRITRNGFVRLEIRPTMEGRRYVETIYDPKKNNFYTCILEDREEGQGYLDRRTRMVPYKIYKKVFRKNRFGKCNLFLYRVGDTGIRRSVMPEGMQDFLYMNPYEVTSDVFDEEGIYGGDQTWGRRFTLDDKESAIILAMVRKYHPDYSDEEIVALLKKLDNEGCGYVVVVNLLFAHFEGRAAAFERTFGFPMYAFNGDLNYHLLLVDFYAATDNHYSLAGVDKINFQEDQKEDEKGPDYNYRMDVTGFGTTQESRYYRMQLYLKDKGVKVHIKNYVAMNPGKLKELCQRGYVMISLKNGNVQNEDGSVNAYVPGHAMIITGITNDCRYIVSTWGRKLYVDPNEVVEKDGKKTMIYYQYFEFE